MRWYGSVSFFRYVYIVLPAFAILLKCSNTFLNFNSLGAVLFNVDFARPYWPTFILHQDAISLSGHGVSPISVYTYHGSDNRRLRVYPG